MEEVAPPTGGRGAWVFQASPKQFDLRKSLRKLPELTWPVRQHRDAIHAGDTVFFWEAGSDGGLLAMGKITAEPEILAQDLPSRRYNRKGEKSEPQLRVPIVVDSVLPEPLGRQVLAAHPALEHLSILRSALGTNFPVTAAESTALHDLISASQFETQGQSAPTAVALPALAEQFVAALQSAHVYVAPSRRASIRALLAALITKPLVLLCGPPGSGKTQLALHLGEWFGEERHLALPVGADWQDSKPLLGAPAGLGGLQGQTRLWHAPAALQFLTRAANDPQKPYLLILDALNVAPVQAYGAEILFAMETGRPCLPQVRHTQGAWQLLDKSTPLSWPSNVFVVGTVQDDGHPLSPRLWDRAGVVELRVDSDDLPPENLAPALPCVAALGGSLHGLLHVARDSQWHVHHPHPQAGRIANILRVVHRLLSPHMQSFGYRTFADALRFAAIYAHMIDVDTEACVDALLCVRILPGLLAQPLRREALAALALFAHDLREPETPRWESSNESLNAIDDDAATARLPQTLHKVQERLRGR